MHLATADCWRTSSIECFLLTPDLVSPAYVDWLNDPDVNRFLESRFGEQTLESVRAFVVQQLADPKALFLGIHSVALGRHIGNIKLGPIDAHHRSGEVGIMLGDPDARGRGLGTEAIRVIGAIAAQQLGLRRLTAGCYESNAASAKAFIKAGFVHEGTRPGHFLLDGRPEGLILMARDLTGLRT